METLTVYLPRPEFRLLSQQFSIINEAICACYYYKKFLAELQKNRNVNIPKEDFFRFTSNAFYDQLILAWCKIFGSYKEPCHYTHLTQHSSIKICLEQINPNISNKGDLLNYLLDNYTTTDAYRKYHRKTKNYRDKYLIHREHEINKVSDGQISFPKTDIAINLIRNYYILLINILKKYPTIKSLTNTSRFTYYPIFLNLDKLYDYLNLTIKHTSNS